MINLIDLYTQRVIYVYNYRIPDLAFGVILLISFLTMLSLGFQFGITDKGSIWITTLLAIIFALVIFLILAMDRPELGLGKADPGPMIYFQQQLKQ